MSDSFNEESYATIEPVDLERLQQAIDDPAVIQHQTGCVLLAKPFAQAILAELTEGRKGRKARIAGMEEAAKICEELESWWEMKQCAEAIRAAIAADQEGE